MVRSGDLEATAIRRHEKRVAGLTEGDVLPKSQEDKRRPHETDRRRAFPRRRAGAAEHHDHLQAGRSRGRRASRLAQPSSVAAFDMIRLER